MSCVRRVSLALASAFVLTACGGGGGPSTLPLTSPGSGVASGVQPQLVTNGFAYDMKALQKSSFQSNAQFKAFGFDVMLKLTNAAGLLQYASEVGDPRSGAYRQFLTPQEIGQRFGAPASSVAAAQNYFASYGLAVARWPQNMMLHVSGSQSALQSAFHTNFGIYKLGSDTIVGPTISPSVPSTLGVVGSPNIVVRPSRFRIPLITGGASPLSNSVTGYSPQQVAAGFDYTSAYAAGYTGQGITIGVIGTGPVAVTGVNGIRLGDVEAMRRLFNVAGSSRVILPAVGDTAGGKAGRAAGFAAPPPVNSGSGCAPGKKNPNNGLPGSESPTATCNPEDGEAQIDIEQTALLAPNATIENYLAYNPNDGCKPAAVAPAACPPGSGIPSQGLLESDAEIQQAIADDTADILSLSFGFSELDLQSTNAQQFQQAQFAALASEGIATFVSSGDNGAGECASTGPAGSANSLCADYPATDPNVVAVGGVTLPLNSAGRLVGPIAAWGVQTGSGAGGSGGGVSILFPTPPYQRGVTYFSPAGKLPLAMRGVPDVSLLGDPKTGAAVVTNADPTLGGPVTDSNGGTSVAAPQMAAMWSLVLQACAQTIACTAHGSGVHPYRLGNPNPLFYNIYGNGSGTQYPTTFDNVVYGSNQQLCMNPSPPPAPPPPPGPPCPAGAPSLLPGYAAGPGYNLVTGIGAPFARALIRTVVGV